MSGEMKERTIQKIPFKIFIVARPSSLSKNGSARSDLHAYFRFVTVLYWVVSDPANSYFAINYHCTKFGAFIAKCTIPPKIVPYPPDYYVWGAVCNMHTFVDRSNFVETEVQNMTFGEWLRHVYHKSNFV